MPVKVGQQIVSAALCASMKLTPPNINKPTLKLVLNMKGISSFGLKKIKSSPFFIKIPPIGLVVAIPKLVNLFSSLPASTLKAMIGFGTSISLTSPQVPKIGLSKLISNLLKTYSPSLDVAGIELPSATMPSMPDIDLPNPSIPVVAIPGLGIPGIDIPGIAVPGLGIIPNLPAPPSLPSTPKFSTPPMPSLPQLSKLINPCNASKQWASGSVSYYKAGGIV